MRKVFVTLVCLLIAGAAYAEIRLGALLAVTGPAGYLGMPEKQTLEMLVEEANAKGGINGEKIQLIVYDTQGEEARAMNFFKRLVTKDKVVAVIGPTRTGTTLAIVPFANKAQVPVISCAASIKIVDPLTKYVFKTPQSDIHVAEKVYQYLAKQGKKKVALLCDQTGYGSAGREAMLEAAAKYGISITGDERFAETDRDMTAQLTKLKNAKPDAIVCWGLGPSAALVAKNAQQLGISNLFMTHGVASKKFIELAGDAANGIMLPAGRLTVAEQLSDKDKFKKTLLAYKKAYEAKFAQPVSAFGGYAYDAFKLFENAWKKSKGNKDAFILELEKTRGFIGTTGEFNMSPKDHNGLSIDSFVMVRIEKGDFKLAE